MKSVLILGATSDIARACAKKFAEEKFTIYLAGRDKNRLAADAKDLQIRTNCEVATIHFDALSFSSHQQFYSKIKIEPDVVICAVGILGDQKKAESDFNESKKIMDTNYSGCVSILNVIAGEFSKRGSGTIIGISSVAGDRGRQSNFIYGSAKAAFTAYLSGLRNRLSKNNVHVITVKPGFVNTSMTEGMNLPGLLTAEPETVANDIYRAYIKNKNIIYTKWFWRYIMMIIIHIPEGIFKKLNL